jgi:hypothetical protein
MKNLKICLVIALFSFGAVVFNSCSNEDEFINNNKLEVEKESECPNMLYFETFEEFDKELQHVITLGINEKAKWAEQKGFNSLGVEAEKFLDNVDPENFKNIDEIKNFIEQHNNYIQLIEEDGEYSVQTIYYNTPLRFFMNEEGIFQVGKYVFKVFDKAEVTTSIQNLDKLKEINENNFEQFKEDTDICINMVSKPKLKTVIIETDCTNGSSGTSQRIKTGKKYYRTKLLIVPESHDYHLIGRSIARLRYKIECQVLSIGWWPHKTTLRAEIQAEVVYTKDGVPGTFTMHPDINYVSEKLKSYYEAMAYNITSISYGYDSGAYLTEYYARGHTDAGVGENGEGEIILSCGN